MLTTSIAAKDVGRETSLQLKHVLLGTDFSDAAHRALQVAIEFCDRVGAQLKIVNVVVPDAYPTAVAAVPFGHSAEVMAARHRMRTFVAEPSLQRLQHRAQVVEGASFVAAWERFIKDEEVDLIIVGSHGRSGMEKLFLGSIAEVIVRHATVPVMVVGPKSKAVPTLRNVLLALELASADAPAVHFAAALADRLGSSLVLSHVCGQSDSHHDVPDVISALKAVLPTDVRTSTRCLALSGDPAKEIVTAATEQAAGAIVVATSRASALTDHAPWSTFTKVIQSAHCPVISIHH